MPIHVGCLFLYGCLLSGYSCYLIGCLLSRFYGMPKTTSGGRDSQHPLVGDNYLDYWAEGERG